MQVHTKPITALIAGAIILSGIFSQTASAQSVILGPNSSTLGETIPPGGSPFSQENLTVSWEVTEDLSDSIYTYSYNVSNPGSDVIYNPDGSLSSTPEDVADISVDVATPNAYIPGTISGGVFSEATPNTIKWDFDVPAGGTSGILSFESYQPPTMGNAIANDATYPAAWESINPLGQQVPVPTAVPEPSAMILIALSGLLFLPFCFPVFQQRVIIRAN